MFFNKQINKSEIKNIIDKLILAYNRTKSIIILENLKRLTFKYATIGGFSLTLNDFRLLSKKNILLNVSTNIKNLDNKMDLFAPSKIENIEKITNSWSETTFLLKNKITEFFSKFDPFNNIFIMATSGARGSMTQVSQMLGLRGLMSDQMGNVVNFPIKNSFKEGLSLLEYLISSYGARKGVVDTALKTADSGYLTRRLVEVSYNILIKDFICLNSYGVFSDTFSSHSFKNGRNLKYNLKYKKTTIKKNTILYRKNFLRFSICKTPITCTLANFSICQSCFGLDFSTKNIIKLGETVGVIAAQSISEPATQLTMRTFHTGGVFSNKTLEENKTLFPGFFSKNIEKGDTYLYNWLNTKQYFSFNYNFNYLDFYNVNKKLNFIKKKNNDLNLNLDYNLISFSSSFDAFVDNKFNNSKIIFLLYSYNLIRNKKIIFKSLSNISNKKLNNFYYVKNYLDLIHFNY